MYNYWVNARRGVRWITFNRDECILLDTRRPAGKFTERLRAKRNASSMLVRWFEHRSQQSSETTRAFCESYQLCIEYIGAYIRLTIHLALVLCLSCGGADACRLDSTSVAQV